MDTPINLRIRRFRDDAVMPTRGSDLAAGFDLYAWIPVDEENYPEPGVRVNYPLTGGTKSRCIHPGTMEPIKTGLNMRIPAGYEVQIRPRSGLAFKNWITVQNSPGTIDADYDGDGEKFEVVVMLRNEGRAPFVVNHGDRIAQMVVNKLPSVVLVEDTEDNLNRNESSRFGGLGSTGV